MLRKGDFFKVVCYPGADKREKRILGQIALWGLLLPCDTGCAPKGASLNAVCRPDSGQGAAQLLKSTFRGLWSQFRCFPLVQLRKGQLGGDTDTRNRYN